MNYIVLDLEFNQAFPFKSGKKVEPNPECPFEIIQIGAVKLNEHFEQLDSFNCMISPQIYPRLHPFVEKITGIRPKMLTGQPHFPEAYQAFLTARSLPFFAHGAGTISNPCTATSCITIWMPMQ